MSEADTGLLSAVGRVVNAFDALEVPYLIGGSIASSVFGEPRQTMDADLLASLSSRHAEPLARLLGPEFYADLTAIRQAIEDQRSFNLIHLETIVKVDVFVRGNSRFGQSQLARRQKKVVGEGTSLELYFASPEDIVLAKPDWYRKGGEISERQWRDVLGVLKVQAGSLDQAYLRRWAEELGVVDLLRRASVEAGPTDHS